MALPTLNKRTFKAEYWDYTTELDPVNGRTDTYFKSKDIEFWAVPGEKGALYVYSKEQLRYNAQLRNIRDTSGNAVFADGISYVGVSEPHFDVYGSIQAYRHDVSQGV